MNDIALENIVQHETAYAGDEGGPTIEVFRRGPEEGRVQLAKVSERHHCPRRTGKIYLSVPSADRALSDPHDSSHPSRDVTIEVQRPDGRMRPLLKAGQGEVAWNWNMGFTYCMTCIGDEPALDLGVFDKNDPVAALLALDTVQFAFVSALCLALHLGTDNISVVHGKVRYLDYEKRNLELRRAATLRSKGLSHEGIEATFIKENRPEFLAQREYRFLYLCDRKDQDAVKVPMKTDVGELRMRDERGDSVELWREV